MSSTERQMMANRYFADTAPNLNTASLAVTLAELLRGDVPSVLKNFRRMQRKSSAAKYIGSESLNVLFGWSPILREVANVLTVMLTIDRMVYSETNRRKRSFDGPSKTVTKKTELGAQQHFNGHNLGGHQFVQLPATYSGLQFTTDQTTVYSENYRFSSRYSAIAKPTLRSNGFADKAEEVLGQLGLIDDPTLVWNLVPWSWLVDWCLNLSASITNAHVYSPLRGKHAVDYAYLTSQLTTVNEERLVSVRKTATTGSYTFYPLNRRGYSVGVSRTRDRATPFGFGTQLGSLSGTQFAILVALGLARSR